MLRAPICFGGAMPKTPYCSVDGVTLYHRPGRLFSAGVGQVTREYLSLAA